MPSADAEVPPVVEVDPAPPRGSAPAPRAVRRTGVGQDELRRANLGAVLSRIHRTGPTSRAVLASDLGLNRSTIGDLSSELADLGLVSEESPAAVGRSGRPSLTVLPRQDVTVVSVAVDVDRITAAVIGLGGVEWSRRTRRHQRGKHDVVHVVQSAAALVREARRGSPRARCLGVGVSVPGAVSATDGLVRFAPNLGWRDEPFARLLASELGLPVSVGNDANLGALAEHLRGAATDVDDVAYVAGSVGIGGGFMLGGVPLVGFDGYAGEVGHILVDSDGPTCRCGAVGCWETKVGENQLLLGAGWLSGGGPEAVVDVIAAADAGDVRAQESLERVAQWTGVGLRVLVNLFNPQMIVLGGLLARTWVARRELVEEGLTSGGLIARRERLVVRAAQLGDDSPLVGASELAFDPLLRDPASVGAA